MLKLNSKLFECNGCIMNASGAKCTTEEELDELSKSSSCCVVTKSCTLESREGNPHPRWYCPNMNYMKSSISINSMGLPNLGHEFYSDYIKNKKIDKPYIISIAGTSMEEGLEIFSNLLEQSDPNQKNMYEINMSCPNIIGKPQIGYDFQAVDKYLSLIDEILYKFTMKYQFNNYGYGIKLPPYFDLIHFEQISDIINKHNPSFVTCINSIGNGLIIDTYNEMVAIRPKNGLGGIGGGVIKSTALANIYMFYKLLKKDIFIVGCGGIQTGEDVFQHILAGADSVQVGTQLMMEGPKCFNRLQKELKFIMKNKGYFDINEFRGKLKTY